jgi:hypothetical protein
MSVKVRHARNNLQFLAPKPLTDAIKAAAARDLTTASEYSRRAVIERLRADGFDPAAPVPVREPESHS